MKPYILFGSSIVLMIVLISAVAFIKKKNEIPENHLQIVLRNIGHQLLVTAKDSTSRVLPVKKLNETTYQISFQNNFEFISDTLINLVQRQLQKNLSPKDYIVNVIACKQQETIFAFEISGKTGNLTPCLGRKLQAGCYLINIEFLKKKKFDATILLLLLIPLGFVAYYVKDAFKKKQKQQPIVDDKAFIKLGSFRYCSEKNVLNIENKTILLSGKEGKALKIFSENINQITEREKLMKEIWEDEGIFVISRNVDVLMSKLRKKLCEDPSVKIINIHGRGYKFTVE